MDLENQPSGGEPPIPQLVPHHITRLKIAAVVLTAIGVGLFAYFVYSIGYRELAGEVAKLGISGFAVLLLLYFLRVLARASAWKLSVGEPYKLPMRDGLTGVIIGEAMSSVIPLGILVSGTAKALAVRRRLPIVVGLSSVATENLFYSFITSLFLILGSLTLIRSFELEEGWVFTIDVLIAALIGVIVFLVLLVVRQWHLASELCEKLYQRGIATSFTGTWRMHIRLFENFIFSFYRQYPKRFLPICFFEIAYHSLGIAEVWYILSQIGERVPHLTQAFLLESVSRLVTIVFKLVPFVIGVDEAGAQFVARTLGMAVGVGVTIALLRKGRMIFWTFIGLVLVVRRGLKLSHIFGRHSEEN